MDKISVRLMAESDVLAADHLRQLIGWNQKPEDWRRLLRLEPAGCFVAHRNQEVVGTVTTTTYGQALAWIGMMLVHPDHRRQGIGTRLMRRAIEYLQGCGVKSIRLDATPAGLPVYQQLGFTTEWTLTRWQLPAGNEFPKPEKVVEIRALDEADWVEIERFDTAAFGASRSRVARSLASHCRKALVWSTRGRIAGWGLLRQGVAAQYLGPIVCHHAEGGIALIAALLSEAGAGPVVLDAPDPNDSARAAAQSFGFLPLRPLTRMQLGPRPAPSDPRAQFAIADPSIG